ncbi:MAG TPA: hypothetical protein VNK41_09640 [Vicinamibacterales bacterium]|nr:hypothetical protein [Vicinamibacterales bacterium]
MTGLTAAAVGALALAALSTAYDAIWALWIPRHHPAFGLVHGMTLLSAVGLVLGWAPRRRLAGLAGGAASGLAAAAFFYVLAPWLRMTAMFPAWMLLWLLFAALDARLNGRPVFTAAAAARGIAAAILSGAAFYAISGIWFEHDPRSPTYAWNFVAWTIAYFPGFAALLVQPRSAARVGSQAP